MIHRKNVTLYPDNKRVILRPLDHHQESIRYKIIARVLSLTDEQVIEELKKILGRFENRHNDFQSYLLKRFENYSQYLFIDSQVSKERKLLIGAYFTQEYSFESTALFNPSIVPVENQNNDSDGTKKYIMSLRATGEGHISSITFREVYIDANNNIEVKEASPFASLPTYIETKTYEKEFLCKELYEKELLSEISEQVIKYLPDKFSLNELKKAVLYVKKRNNINKASQKILDGIILTALSNYEIEFNESTALSERIIFPNSPSEINGIEDARFVKYREQDNEHGKYYATYTAYDGYFVIPQMIETTDFIHFKIKSLNGSAVQNKGFALFPKKINGKYAMLSRQDKENLFIMYSDQLFFWHDKKIILRPHSSWEFSKVGNCGSPIETEEGWLVLTHGVGSLKQYSIGAVLLDFEKPEKVIGRLDEPLITPNENERNGYVPNVVYTCGAVIHNEHLVIPYAFSDMATTFATVDLKELITKLKK